MDVKLTCFISTQKIKEIENVLLNMLHNVLLARLLDSCFDTLAEIRTQQELKEALEEMSKNVSICEKNKKLVADFLKDCERDVRALIKSYYWCLARALKVSYESIKNQYHLKYEV